LGLGRIIWRTLGSFVNTPAAVRVCLPTSFHRLSTAPAPAALHALSLHDALPISPPTDRPAPGPRARCPTPCPRAALPTPAPHPRDRKSTRLNSSHVSISYAVFCLEKKKNLTPTTPTRTRRSTYATAPRQTTPRPT